MAEARKMSKTELFAHFVEHFAAVNISLKRADAREFFEELQRLCEQQLQDCGEFTLPGIAKLVWAHSRFPGAVQCVGKDGL